MGSQKALSGGWEGAHLSGRATLPCVGLELFLRRRPDWLLWGRDARRQGLAQRVGFENLSLPFFFSFIFFWLVIFCFVLFILLVFLN